MNKSFYVTVTNIGNNTLWTGYENGEKFYRKESFSPTLFVRETRQNIPPLWKSLHGEPLKPIRFDTIREARDYVRQYDSVGNVAIHGNTNYVAQFIADRFPDGLADEKITTDDLNICFFDGEMIDENGSKGFPSPVDAPVPVVSLALFFTRSKRKIILGLKSSTKHREGVEFIRCETEFELLSKFCQLLEVEQTDMITGWNIRTFDVPYIIKRLERYMGSDGPKKLSPFSFIKEKSIVVKGKENPVYDIIGIAQVDYLDIFKKFSSNTFGTMENYRLDTIAKVVLGEGKLDYSDEYTNLTDLYNGDYETFIDYNMRDVMALVDIDDAIKYIDIALSIAFLTGSNIVDTLGTTAVWDAYISRELLKEHTVIPPNVRHTKTPYEGAYVKEPLRGLYKWVVSVDLASLYPNIIIQSNQSPETIVQNGDLNHKASVQSILDKKVINPFPEKYTMTANGVYFRKDTVGVIPRLVEGIFDKRKIAKKEMINAQKQLELIGIEKHRRGL